MKRRPSQRRPGLSFSEPLQWKGQRSPSLSDSSPFPAIRHRARPKSLRGGDVMTPVARPQMGEVVAGARANPLPPRAAWAFKDGKPAEAHCRTRPFGDHCNCFPGTYYTNKAKVLGRLRLPVRSDNCW